MGTGIGIVGSHIAGLEVKLVDPGMASRQNSEIFMRNWANKAIAKGKMD